MQAEGQQDRLLQPLVHHPVAVALLGHAQLAGVEEIAEPPRPPSRTAPVVSGVISAAVAGAIDESLEIDRGSWRLSGQAELDVEGHRLGGVGLFTELDADGGQERGSASVRWWNGRGVGRARHRLVLGMLGTPAPGPWSCRSRRRFEVCAQVLEEGGMARDDAASAREALIGLASRLGWM